LRNNIANVGRNSLEGFRRLNTIKAHSDKTAYFRALITKAIFALSERDCALQWRMPAPTRQKITFGEMRAAGVRGLLVYCADYKCSHWNAISGDRWPDGARLSDIEQQFVCKACGRIGADVCPNFHWEAEARTAKIPDAADHGIPSP
jgi:hypothetical protein